jgi:hypothetical protein
VDGAVAADDDEERRPVVCRLSGEVAELTGPAREDGLPAQPGGVRGASDLGPAFPRLPVRRRGIDEEDGVAQR